MVAVWLSSWGEAKMATEERLGGMCRSKRKAQGKKVPSPCIESREPALTVMPPLHAANFAGRNLSMDKRHCMMSLPPSAIWKVVPWPVLA